MAHVAEHGYPVVRVLAAAGSDLVLERLAGPTMLEALASAQLDVRDAARALADLHAQLHAIPGLGPDHAERILHLDLHPENVVLTPRGAVVIDWRNARDGVPDLDAAMSALILSRRLPWTLLTRCARWLARCWPTSSVGYARSPGESWTPP